MKTLMVRYKTADKHADTNAHMVRAVYDELRAASPAGLRYATYRLADGVTFIHLATYAVDASQLTRLPAFKAFQAGLKARCVEPPVRNELPLVDSYGVEAQFGSTP